jgi:Domain of unknown function (DUF4157)
MLRTPQTFRLLLRKRSGHPGSPLDAQTRAFMQSRFGNDFAHVRVHTGDKAAASARSVGATAYTLVQ